MPAIAVQSKEHGPITVPLTSVSVVRKDADGTALIVLSNGREMATSDVYEKVSGRMVSVQVWGAVTTEAA